METESEEQLVPMILTDVRTFWLQVYGDRIDPGEGKPVARPIARVPVLPGLNYKRESIVRGADIPSARKLNVQLRPQDPTQLDYLAKEQLVSMTTSKDALRIWRKTEPDAEICALIDARLG